MSFRNAPSFFLDFSQRDMKGENGHSYGFGQFTLDVSERRLSDGTGQISLTPKAFDVLSFLVQNAGHLVEKEEVMKHIWPDSFVEESNVARIVHMLRRKLGDDGNGNSFIETIPTKGYRFIADVEIRTDLAEASSTKACVENALGSTTIETADALRTEREKETGRGTETNHRRQYFVFAAVVALVVLATGIWIVNRWLQRRPSGGVVRHSSNGEAYRNFEKGKLLVESNPKEALEKFERAIELDPDYAEALAGKADAMSVRGFNSLQNADVATLQAALRKALALDPDSSYVHTVQCRIMGTYYWYIYDAVTECQHAVNLNPSDDGAHRELGLALNVVGRPDEALSEMDTAIAISPTSNNKRGRGMVLYMARRYDEAMEQFEQLQATDPDFIDSYKWLMLVSAMKNDQATAFENLVRFDESLGASVEDLNAARSAFATGGWPAAVRVVLSASTGIASRPRFVAAQLYSQIGEKDKAFDAIEYMRETRYIMMVNLPRDPILDPIRDDPRFAAILSEMNLK